MIFNSIRWRLQAWHGLILVLVLAGFGFTAYHVARDNQLRRIDQELRDHLMMAIPPGPPNRPQGFPGEGPPDRPPGFRGGGRGDRGPGEPGGGRQRGPAEGGPPEGGERPRSASTLRSATEDGDIPVRSSGPATDGTPDPGERPPGGFGEGRRRPEPAEFRLRMRESMRENIEKIGTLAAGQTNVFYYVLWLEDGSILAQSAGAPKDVPRPVWLRPPELTPAAGTNASATSPRPRPFGPPMFAPARTRGERREAYRLLPGGELLLVGRGITPDLAAMRRLAVWLGAAGTAVLLFGLAGGWWLATRAIRPIEDISATALKISAGDLSQRINAANTDSELGRLASVLNSAFARLEAAFAHQARFTSDASHELRTPVSVILSQTQTALSRERGAPEYREALEACQRAAQRMRKLTESLLELARLDAGQQPMKREPFDLARVARDCVELVRPLAAERAIELRCDLPAVECLGDAERISQVVTNLLSNAIHFNQPHGEVRISTRAENGAASLTVADTGEGIPPADQPHIFERFYRVDQSRSGKQGRTGLGLAISKAIVDAHSGTLEVASQPGAGSTFSVKLPLK